MKQFDDVATSHKIINVVDNDAPPTNNDGRMGGVAIPQTSYTNIIQSSDIEDDTIITVDNPSSEGTVSVSPSPPGSHHSAKDDINITVAHDDPPIINKVSSDLPYGTVSNALAVSKTPLSTGSDNLPADRGTIASYSSSQDSGQVLRNDIFMSPYIKNNSARELTIASSSRPSSPPPSPSLPQAINTSQPFEIDEEDDFVMVSTRTIGQPSSGFINTFVPVSANSPSLTPAPSSNKPASVLATGYMPHSSPVITTKDDGLGTTDAMVTRRRVWS